MENFNDIIIMLATSVVVVALFRRLQLPPILGYLYVGMVVGPHGMGFIDDVEGARHIAEFGVVFLLFTIGLEFSLPQLIAMRWMVLGLGGAQVVICTLIVTVIGRMLGLEWIDALVIGGALAMSSTALVIKQLDEQVELNARHGRTAVSVLLFQDLAVVPFLILIPIVADPSATDMAPTLVLALVKAAGVFGFMLLAGRIFVRPLFHEIASARSTELFTLTVLLVTILAAWTTHLADLSLALGAFLAGMMLGETEYRHQVESDIRPFRDVLLGLFFVTIGMLLDWTALQDHWQMIVGITIALVIGKFLLVVFLMQAMRLDLRVSYRSSMVLAQGGEFGFALISLALTAGLLDESTGQIILAAVFCSMVVAPLLIRFNDALSQKMVSWGKTRADDITQQGVSHIPTPLQGQALILGYGRTGQNLARFLEAEGIPFIALDLDPDRVKQARSAGEPAAYGDATRPEILEAAGLEQAKLVLITFAQEGAALKVLQCVRRMRPDIPIIVRTRDASSYEKFKREGATEIVPEVLEASLMLASHCLPLLDVPISRVIRKTREVRKDDYRLLREFFRGQERVSIETAQQMREQLRTVALPDNAYANGKALSDVNLEELNVTVTAIRRRTIRVPDPSPSVKLIVGDVLVLYGLPQDLERAEAVLLSGHK